ncbi:MAG: DNA polymerase III subunit alpha [bacterium]
MSSKFVHLHTHSHYSLLDGLTKLEDMVDIAKKNGQTAVALTDHGNMYGAIEFYKVARKAGIKPIIGVEAYVTSGSRLDKVAVSNGKRYYHLILLAKNLQGYKNLIRLVTIANLEGYYYKPRMDKEILRTYHEGIVCLSACLGGELSQAVLANDMDKADDIVREHLDIFGKENYFIEVQSHPHIENDKLVRERLIALARKHDVTIVATQDSHYPCRDDHEAHHTLLAINTQGDGNTGKFEFPDDDFSLIDEKTALEYFADIPEAVANTSKVADLCENYEIELGVAYFPEFPLPEGITADMKLRELSYDGFAFRDLEQTKPYLDRLEYELSVIKQKGYAGYFLVVGDLLKFARENGILTNIRGSVAGSLTTYLIGITNVDPLVYKLPFERFLNPERPSLPDIDMDYADNRRGEMIEYAKRRYGEDRVAQIGTFGTMMAKGSVRDVARALGYPYAIGDRISALIPMGSQGFPMTITHAMELIPELADAYKKEADTKRIIDLALKLEGCVRHVSVHAAGVVIAPKPLYEFAPVQYDPKGGSIITQYDMHYIEDVGLPKFDFLGIRNLAILADAVRLVKELRGVDVNLDKVPLEDARTFEILARGETMGLFQLNGSGMTAYLKQLKPTTIHDINAMVALYRPGPMEMIPQYIERKENPSLVRYLDPRMKDILDQSYGVITYQDDVMMIAIKLAGYSWLEADKLRKAMGKKIPAEMEAQKKHLLEGFVEHGLSEKKAQELWALIEPFAAYGFNKAHAASYGRVAYQTAYMKANFPVEYLCAILTAESGDTEKVAEIINEAVKMGITVLPPEINASFADFTVVNNSNVPGEGIIRFGLLTIKNFGADIANAIIEERRLRGDFKSVTEFLERITHKNLNKKSMEALIKAGAFDNFGERGQLLANMEVMLAYNKERQNIGSQVSLFGDLPTQSLSLTLAPAPKAETIEKLKWEKELLGLYVSGHPLERIRDRIEKSGMTIKKIRDEVKPGFPVTFACIVEEVKIIFTKKNEQMAFVKVGDLTSSIEGVLFTKPFAELQNILLVDTVVAVQARVSERNGEKSLVIEKAKAV